MNLRGLFDKLPAPKGAVSEVPNFQVLPIPGFARYWVGKNSGGDAALLIETRGASHSTPPPLHLHSLVVYHNVTCRVTEGRATTNRTLTVVWCVDPNAELRAYFLSVLGPVVLGLGPDPTSTTVARAIENLVELFRRLVQPPIKSVQGLWGELFVIATGRDPRALVDAWHAVPNERYDFHAGPQRIEVKSAATSVRRHRFSLDQLRPPAGATVWVASVLLARAVGGTSLKELIDRIGDACKASPNSQAHLYEVVSSTLGSSLSDALEERFDEQVALQSKRLFDYRDVPSIDGEIPSAVSDVRFIADLSRTVPLTDSVLNYGTGLFCAV
jgi:hypothetical protein